MLKWQLINLYSILTEHSDETDGGQNPPTEPPIKSGGKEGVRAEDQRTGGWGGGS